MGKILEGLFGGKKENAPARDVAALVASLTSPAVHIRLGYGPALSHFGGTPRLPSGMQWPERNGAKLGFLARLSMREIQQALPIAWLPDTGALLFFYDIDTQPWGFDPKDRGGAAVLHVPDLAAPIAMPGAISDSEGGSIPHRNVFFRRIEVFPSVENEQIRQLELSATEFDAYIRICDAAFGGKRKHQLTGVPSPVQGDHMDLECQLASHGVYCGTPEGYKSPRALELMHARGNWRLLLQLDSDDDLQVMWGDSGTLYYWVEEPEAKQQDFQNAWVILQCS